jgi:competence protein ComEA
MKSSLKDLFSFNTTERNGILILIILIVFIAFAPEILTYIYSPPGSDTLAFSREIAAFELSLNTGSDSVHLNEDRGDESSAKEGRYEEIHLFKFNPNGLAAEKWKQLGLKDWQVKVIKNYESKGGKFRKKEDLGKIYGISINEYSRLEPFIEIPEPEDRDTTKSRGKIIYQKRTFKVNLNTADSTDLLELIGIGPSFAKRIIKFRDILGGFYSVKQLMEVYGFNEERFGQVADHCEIGLGPFRKFNLNSVSTSDLKKHPYFDYYSAKAIIDRRITRGNYTSVDQVGEIPSISNEQFEKMLNYLEVEE